MPALNLSAPKAIEKLTAPGWYSMVGQTSFGVRVSKAGAKSYYWVSRVEGTLVWKRLGGVGEISFDTARRAALNNSNRKVEAEQGDTPFAPATAVPKVEPANDAPLLLAECFKFYFDRHGRTVKRPQQLQAVWDRHCQPLAAKPVTEIDREAVQLWHDGIAKGPDGAPVAALHAVQLLRAVVRYCAKFPKASRWPATRANPFAGIEVGKAKKRKRKLEGDDLKAFASAAEQHPDEAIRAFLLALHVTGARISELQLATVQQYDRDRRCIVWADSKNDEERVLTLGPVTAKLVGQIIGKRMHGLIWPGGCKDGSFDFRKAWAATCKAAGVSKYTFHDARRSFSEALASHNAEGHFSDLRIEELLGHKLQGVQANYRYLDVHSPVRAKAAVAMEAAMGLAKRSTKPATTTKARRAA